MSPPVAIGVVYPSYPLVNDFWEAMKRIIPADEVAGKSEAAPRRLVLKNGAQIEVRSGSEPDMLVAAGYDMVVLGEAALLPHGSWLAVMPMLASPGRGPEGDGGIAVLQSTPRGQNWFAREKENGTWWCLIAPYYDAGGQRHLRSSPLLPEAEVESQRAQMPERWFAQEYLCEFLAGEGQVFQRVRERIALAPDPPRPPVVVGVDLAKYADFTALVALDSDGRMVAYERMNTVSYQIQAERCCSFLITVGARKAVVESNGPGEAFYDMLSGAVHSRRSEFRGRCELIPFATTASSKKGMIDALAVAFEGGYISILDDPQLVSEFEQYALAATKSGYVTFSAPEGAHDDFVMATALAYTETAARRPQAHVFTDKVHIRAGSAGNSAAKGQNRSPSRSRFAV